MEPKKSIPSGNNKLILAPKEKKMCFVIMPFGGWFDTYYNEIYCPAVQKSGLEIHRADDLYAPNNIVSDIWEYTQKADIILADLTGKNPNVFYELGLAHAISKPVILITEIEEDIPFDLRAIRVLKYNKNEPDWGTKLKNSIEKSIKEITKNPQISVPAVFLKERISTKELTVTKVDKDVIELRQELELLRSEIRRRNIAPRDIGPERAKEMIEEYISGGMSESSIIRRVSNYGPPTHWIRSTIAEIKEGKSQAATLLDDF